MLSLDLGLDKKLEIVDLKLRGYKGANLISIIKDYLTVKSATALFEVEDDRVTQLIDIQTKVKNASGTDKLALEAEMNALNIKNYKFYSDLTAQTEIDFTSLYELLEVNVFTYFKVDKNFVDPDLYTIGDLLLVLEAIVKEPSNNLYRFLESLQSQIVVVAD
jgi:hypothetical protein